MNTHLDVRTQGVNVAGTNTASITPSLAAVNTQSSAKTVGANFDPLKQGGFSRYSAQIATGQQQVTTTQIAEQALLEVGKALQGSKKLLTQALRSPNSSNPEVAQALKDHQQTISQTLSFASTKEGRVLDAQLNVLHDAPAIRQFTIPGLNLTRLREQPEQIRLDFPQQGTVLVSFTPDADDKQIVDQLDRSLIPLGMRVRKDDNGQLLFQIKDGNFKQMQQQVLVTGQGHRYPAGQANAIRTQVQPEGVEDLRFDLSSKDGIREGISQVNKYLKQVQSSLAETKEQQAKFQQQASFHQARNAVSTPQQATQLSQDVFNREPGFKTTFQALNSQANVQRHSAVGLLKS